MTTLDCVSKRRKKFIEGLHPGDMYVELIGGIRDYVHFVVSNAESVETGTRTLVCISIDVWCRQSTRSDVELASFVIPSNVRVSYVKKTNLTFEFIVRARSTR